MLPTIAKSELSQAQVRLIEMFQQLNFGRVEGLVVRNGQPVFKPACIWPRYQASRFRRETLSRRPVKPS